VNREGAEALSTTATVAEFGDSRTFLRQCGQAFIRLSVCLSVTLCIVAERYILQQVIGSAYIDVGVLAPSLHALLCVSCDLTTKMTTTTTTTTFIALVS